MRNRSRTPAETDPGQTELGIAAPAIADVPRKKNRAAVALGRVGGKKGGRARAERLSPERRRLSASVAASVRWAKTPAAMVTPAETIQFSESGEALPPSPFAKHKGELSFGGHSVDVYVLDTGDRVISLRAVVKSIAGIDASNLGDYIGVEALKPFINSDLILGETKEFHNLPPW